MPTLDAAPRYRPLPTLAPELARLGEERWGAYRAVRDGQRPADLSDALRETGRVVFALSDFVFNACYRQPGLLCALSEAGDLDRALAPEAHADRLEAALAGVSDEAALRAVLRRQRTREMVRIAWRDLAGLADLTETVTDLSALADAVLRQSLDWLYRRQCVDLGTPLGRDGRPQQMVVLAMGKLGGHELNFSSDIDLIFTMPEEGETRGGRREMACSEFFNRLGQRLIPTLSERTADGFVFRVDMRLRPFGASGPLVMSFDGMEAYYQTHGRDWERYALIKARPVAGDLAAGERLLDSLRPFVYRRYLDFGAFESLREMKTLIAQEVTRKGLQGDLKLGPGGIREVEFVAQALQLVRGGRDPSLRGRGLRATLRTLESRQHLPSEAARELDEAYVFLRRAEHRLQAVDDRQTQALPVEALARARLACAMGHAAWEDFEQALGTHRGRVDTHFRRVFAPANGQGGEPLADAWRDLWLGPGDPEAAERVLGDAGFESARDSLEVLEKLRGSHAVRLMSRHGRQRLDRLLPLLLEALRAAPRPAETLRRVVPLLEAVARRSVYLSLLIEHPVALSQLVSLCAASPWVAEQIRRHPILLDELLDPRTLYAPPDRAGLQQQLDELLSRLPRGDTEQELDTLRLFKHANVLRVAAADVSGALPLMKVSDHLTDIAEVLLVRVVDLAWRDLVERHGPPGGPSGANPQGPTFGVVAYGKLGGIELGYGSDLDLIFLQSGAGEGQSTAGPRPLPNAVFFARLAQRVVHTLTAHTAGGILYEVDFRLRPSGRSGLLVSSVEAFEEYQLHEAWTWEHQALVRARPVVADPVLAERVRAIRLAVLSRAREPEELRRDVREMREKMRQHLGGHRPGRFDLKQDRGGIADIEFMVQYLALRWGHDFPGVLRFTDNIRLLEGLAEAGCLPRADADLLADAYRAYRSRVHALSLQGEGRVVDEAEVAAFRGRVSELWRDLLEA